MCLTNFIEFKQISEDSSITGYRIWRTIIENPSILISENQNYNWNGIVEGPHLVLDQNSGIYAYNNYHNYYHNYYHNNYNYNYYYNIYNSYYNYNNCNSKYYNVFGIINQFGRVAVHKTGQRSEYAKITKLFTIRESDIIGPYEFINWVKEFNLIVGELAKKYECETIHWQDFLEQNK